MIRFRLGKSWKREPVAEGGPKDAFGFELDGVNLLPGVTEEPLARVVATLTEAVRGMVADGERGGQFSLEDVQREVCFWRRPGLEVEVSVVDLSQPPRRVGPVTVLELPALVDASLQCARGFLREAHGWSEALGPEWAHLERQVKALAGSVVREVGAEAPAPWRASREGALGYWLEDRDGRTLTWSRRSRAGLPPLLLEGELVVGAAKDAGLPFLALMGLARAASEGPVAVLGQRVEPTEVFACGLDLCLALRARSLPLASNPWLEALQVRCVDGLKALRAPVPVAPPPSEPERAPSQAPLAAQGALRRVSLSPSWSRPVALGEDGGRLLLSKTGVVVHSAHAAHGFSRSGATTFRRLSTRGVACSAQRAVCASPERLSCFEHPATSADWVRDADGAQVGPQLVEHEDLLVTPLGRRGLAGLCLLTGRERWRFDPPRTQRSALTTLGSLALLTTDAGALIGLDLRDGAVRFTVRSSMPCLGPAVAWGRRALVLLNRGEHTPVVCCEVGSKRARAGTVAWTRELLLSTPKGPVVSGGRVFVGGGRGGQAFVVALSKTGQFLWERAVPLDPRTMSLVASEKGVLVGDAHGAAARLLPDGDLGWVLGSSGDELVAPVALVLRRQVLVVPGPKLRLVDPASGRVLAQVETGPRVTDVAVDERLTIYVLQEPGLLEAWKPGAVLAVV